MQTWFRGGTKTDIHLGNLHYVLHILTHQISYFLLSNCITHVISGKILVCVVFNFAIEVRYPTGFRTAEISYLPFSAKFWITQKGFTLIFQRRALCISASQCPSLLRQEMLLVALAVSKQGDAGFPEPKSRSMHHLCLRYEVAALRCFYWFLWKTHTGCIGACTCFSNSSLWITGKTKPEGAYSKKLVQTLSFGSCLSTGIMLA